MTIDVFNKTGAIIGQTELPDSVFAIQPRRQAMHRDRVAYLANQRQGTKKTKTRDEVSGGGKKPFRQKGTGGARAGSRRSPLMHGGGTIHGPKPIDYRMDLPRKMKQVARKSALSTRASENNILVLDDMPMPEVKTKIFVDMLKALKLDNTSVLILIPEDNKNLYLASRNIPKVSLDVATRVSTYDILTHRRILIFKDAIEPLVKIFEPKTTIISAIEF
jgi:large subunit ribosomal protein L4